MVALDVPGNSLDDILGKLKYFSYVRYHTGQYRILTFCNHCVDEMCATHLGLTKDNNTTDSPTATWHAGSSDSGRKRTMLSDTLSGSTKGSIYEKSMSRIPQKLLTGTQFGEVR